MSGAQAYVEPQLNAGQGHAVWLILRGEVVGRGLAAPCAPRTAVKLLVLAPLLALSLSAAWLASSAAIQFLAWIALALLLAQCAFVGHDAGHGSIARSPLVNRVFGQLAMTLVTGLAFDEWIGRHRAHHRFCQDQARDPDMEVSWVASLTEESLGGKKPAGRFMTRHQGVHLWFLSFLFGHSQRHLSQAAVLRSPGTHALDAAMLVLHFALWFGVPCVALGVPAERALLAYVAPLTLLGPYLAAIFWINHVGMPLVRDIDAFSFLEHQAVTSRTILNPPRWDWVFGGLNFQVEHHLFPQVPSFRLARLHPIVRAELGRNGIAYNGCTWPEAVRRVAGHFARIARCA